MNQVNLIGRLAQEVETRQTSNGTSASRFNVAVRSYVKLENGENKTDFIPVEAFGKSSDIVSGYNRGDLIRIEGRIEQDKWQDRETGKTVSRIKIVATHVYRVNKGRVTLEAVNSEPQIAEVALA